MNKNNIRVQILSLAWPAILEMMLHTMVWTVDTAMIGRLNPAAITGTNLGSQMMFTVANILGALGIGASALVARNVGAGDYDRAQFIAGQTIGLGAIISVLFGFTGIIFAPNIFELIVKDPEVILLGTQYLRIVLIGGCFLIPLFVCNAILRGSGNTVIPMISAIIANTLNIIGDYILIFGKFGFPQLGVAGAAIATAAAQIISFLFCIGYIVFGNSKIKLRVKEIFKFNLKTIKEVLNLSFPAGLEMLVGEGSRLVGVFWIAQLGTIAFAANSITVAAESLSFMPAYGFAIAASSLVGQYLGAEDPETAEKCGKTSAKYSMIFMSIIGIAFFIFPKQIMGVFTTNVQTVELAAQCLRISAFEQITIAIIDVYSGALKGAGDTKGPFKISLIASLGIRLPLIFLVVFVFKASVIYVWMATVTQYLIQSAFIFYRYKKGEWKNIKIR